jgi:hypothetical protein
MLNMSTLRRAGTTDFAQRRVDSIIENQDYMNIFPSSIFFATRNYFGRFAIMVILATLVLIMPLVVVDRMRNVQSVQYAAKVGRRLMFRQMAAVTLASLLLTTLLLVLFGGIYFRGTEAHFFWHHSIFSFTHHFVALFDFTFGQYVLALVGIAYAVGLAAAWLAFIVSRFSRNLIIATMKTIPVFAGLAVFAFTLNNSGTAAPFHMAHRFYRWTNWVGVEAIVCVLLVALSFVAVWWVARRDRRVDVG